MERKVRVLIGLGLVLLPVPYMGYGQGLVVEMKEGMEKPTAAGAAEHIPWPSCAVGFGAGAGISLPPYGYLAADKVLQHYKSPVCTPNLAFDKEKNTNVEGSNDNGAWTHYLSTPDLHFVLWPLTGELAKTGQGGQEPERGNVGRRAFGLCFNSVRNELYVSYIDNPWVRIFDGGNLALLDSMRLLGSSGRYMAVSGSGQRLYVGVRSCRAIVMFDLDRRKMGGFVKTGNLPGPLYWSDNDVLYGLGERQRVLSKFDGTTLAHLESLRLDLDGAVTWFGPTPNGLAIVAKENWVEVMDTLALQGGYYAETGLDSAVGAYTWIASSHIKPKWALVRMQELQKLGLSCSLGRMSDGFYRVCVGVYPNQEKAVEEKNAHAEALKGAWLMSINPKKF